MAKSENDSLIDLTQFSTSEPILKPCPLCGADMQVRYEESGPYWIHPGRRELQWTDCSLRNVVIIDEPEEIDAWNKRP